MAKERKQQMMQEDVALVRILGKDIRGSKKVLKSFTPVCSLRLGYADP